MIPIYNDSFFFFSPEYPPRATIETNPLSRVEPQGRQNSPKKLI